MDLSLVPPQTSAEVARVLGNRHPSSYSRVQSPCAATQQQRWLVSRPGEAAHHSPDAKRTGRRVPSSCSWNWPLLRHWSAHEDSSEDDIVTFGTRACTCIAGVNDESSGTCQRAVVDNIMICRDQHRIERCHRIQIPSD